MLRVNKALIAVQAALNVPKSTYNSYGKYYYRNAEDIVEAAKPLCIANGLLLTLSDDVVQVGERTYVKATAAVVDSETGERVETTAFARESDKGKNGMDESQVTGSTSSYARKYALNGLFAIDDNKDADDEACTTAAKPKLNKKPDNEKKKADNSADKSTFKVICTNCKKEIVASGKMTAETIVDRSLQKFGKIMCYDCSVAANKNGGK